MIFCSPILTSKIFPQKSADVRFVFYMKVFPFVGII